jgi:transcription initiation factor IIE alpha subunit
MPMPCPSCKTTLGLDLQFIIKNPISVCPGCGVILDFTVNDEIKEKYSDAMKTINSIKSKYKDIAKFGGK